MQIHCKSCQTLALVLYCSLPSLILSATPAQVAVHDTSNIMVRVATNPAAQQGEWTSPDNAGVSLSDCDGQQATVDSKSVTSTIPSATPRQFQVDPDSDDPADVDLKLTPTTRMIEIRHPASCQYALRVEGYKHGEFGLQLHAQGTISDNAFLSFDAIPVYLGSR